MNLGDVFNLIFLQPLLNLLVFIMRILDAASIPGSLGFSIVVLTVIVRFLTWPFIASQIKAAAKMSELKPRIDEIKKKHGSDKKAVAQAQMALYKEHGVNPAGGCLPAIVQILMIAPLYQVINAAFDSAKGLDTLNYFLYFPEWSFKVLPNPYFFGVNLADKPSDFLRVGVLILLVPLITAALTFIQSKMMAPKPLKSHATDSSTTKHEKKETDEAIASVQTQMMYMMPVMVGFFSWQFPVGLALYWNTLTALGIWQQHKVAGWGGLEPWISRWLKK